MIFFPLRREKSRPGAGRKASSSAATRGWRCAARFSQLAAVLQVRGDARGPEGVVPDPGLDASSACAGNAAYDVNQFLDGQMRLLDQLHHGQ